MEKNNSKPEKILLIEDDSFFQILCGYYLNLLGYQNVDIVASAEEGLTKSLASYNLIISDFNLGKGLNGAQFAKQACEQAGKRLPIMLVSSGRDEAIFQVLQMKVAQVFLAKPFTFSEFKKETTCLIKAKKPKTNKTCSAHKIKFFYHRFLKPELQKALAEYFPEALPRKALVLVDNSLQQQLLSVILKQQGFAVVSVSESSALLENLLQQVDLVLLDQNWHARLDNTFLTTLQHQENWLNKPKLFLLSHHEQENMNIKIKFDVVFKLNCLAV